MDVCPIDHPNKPGAETVEHQSDNQSISIFRQLLLSVGDVSCGGSPSFP